MIQAKTTVIDFNLLIDFGQSKYKKKEGFADEYREHRLCPTNGLRSTARVPKVSAEIPWQLQSADFFMAIHLFSQIYFNSIPF